MVTGFEDGKRFALVVTPEDLVDRQKVKEENAPPLVTVAENPNAPKTVKFETTPLEDVLGGALADQGITGTANTPDAPANTPRSKKNPTQGSADYAGRRVGEDCQALARRD